MKWTTAVRRLGPWALLPALGAVAACNNILEWTVDSESFEALMADGRQAIQEADYATAEEKFAAAVELRPENSEARFYVAKAAVLNGGVDVFSLVQTLTEEETGQGGATEIFNFNLDTANSVYRVNRIVVANLEPIKNGEATEGDFAVADVDLDLAVAYTLRGILRLRDTNGDGIIGDDDVSLDDFNLVDDNGDYNLDGIENIPPEDVNDMIGDLNEFLDDGGDLLTDVLGDTGVDVDELNDLIDSLGGDLSGYYINTGVPGNSGEGDNDNDGVADEECLNGVDDDADGLVDEDARIFGCP
jgi:hypothetical protein